MKLLASRWRWLAAASLLAVLCGLHQSPAQPGRPSGGIGGGGIGGVSGAGGAGIRGGIGGAAGNIGGIGGAVGNVGGIGGNVGGFPRNPGNIGGGIGGNIGNPGQIGGMPGIGGGVVFTYKCSRCKAQVSETASSCPSCGARFSNRPGGWNDDPGDIRFRGAGDSGSFTPGSKDSGGLSAGVIIGVAAAGMLVIGGIVAIVLFQSGGKPKRARKRSRIRDDYDD